MKIDFDSLTKTMTVDGVRISFEVLEGLVNPRSNEGYHRWLRFERKGDEVFVHERTIKADYDFREFSR